MSVTLVNNSPQLTVATAGTRGLTGAHVVSASFSGSNLIITLSDGTVVNAGGGILSASGSNNWIGQQAINGNVIVTGSHIRFSYKICKMANPLVHKVSHLQM